MSVIQLQQKMKTMDSSCSLCRVCI